MELIAAIILCTGIGLAGHYLNYNRDTSYYPTILIVIALLYVLFAIIDGRGYVIMHESTVAAVFVAGALMGSASTKSYRWIAALLILHALYDFMHPVIIDNQAVPSWWPMFCLYVDLILAGWVWYLGYRGKLSFSEK